MSTSRKAVTICCTSCSAVDSPWQRIGVGEKVALEIRRRRIDVANQGGVPGGGDEVRAAAAAVALVDLRHLLDRQSFGERDRTEEHVAARELVDHFTGAHRLIEAIFTGLQAPRLAAPRQRRAKADAVADHTALGQATADQRRSGAWRNLDELLVAFVALVGLLRPDEQPDGGSGTGDDEDDDDDEKNAAQLRSRRLVSQGSGSRVGRGRASR